MYRIPILISLLLMPLVATAQPGSAPTPPAVREQADTVDAEVAAHGNRRPRDEVTPEEKAAQYARMWATVAGAGAAAVFGVGMRMRLSRSDKGA